MKLKMLFRYWWTDIEYDIRYQVSDIFIRYWLSYKENQIVDMRYQVLYYITYQISSIRYGLSDIMYQVSCITYQASDIKYQVSTIISQVTDIKCLSWGIRYQISDII